MRLYYMLSNRSSPKNSMHTTEITQVLTSTNFQADPLLLQSIKIYWTHMFRAHPLHL